MECSEKLVVIGTNQDFSARSVVSTVLCPVCSTDDMTRLSRLNMEIDHQSLFGLHVT
jgi:hypothetical protein